MWTLKKMPELRDALQDLREHARVENHRQHRSARAVVSEYDCLHESVS